jgi:predicted nucleotidyltransferase
MSPKHTRLKRKQRLVVAKDWVRTYRGKNLVRGYRKHFGVDWLCAVTELQMLGYHIPEDYIKQLQMDEDRRRKVNEDRRRKREAEQVSETLGMYSNEYFYYIAGYTSGGAPFGITWEEMERMRLAETQSETIISFLKQRLNPYLIMLFGSAARGKMHADSDVDIAFLSDMVCDEAQLYFIAQELAIELDRDIHLINLNIVSTVLQAQVISTGEIIYEQDKLRRQEFFVLVMKKYARLNEERAPILDRIKERGSIYAG